METWFGKDVNKMSKDELLQMKEEMLALAGKGWSPRSL